MIQRGVSTEHRTFPRAPKTPQSQGRLVPVPATLLTRSQPDRDGLLKLQGLPAHQLRQNLRVPLVRRRRHLQPLRARRVLELP